MVDSGGDFNRYWYANNNPYKFTDFDGRQAMQVQCQKAGCDTTTKGKKVVEAAKKMIALTQRAVKAGGTEEQKENLANKTTVVVMPDAPKAPITGGAIETAITHDGNELLTVTTTVSNQVLDMDGHGPISLTGADLKCGDMALEFAGTHDMIGHGSVENATTPDPHAREVGATKTALKLMKADTNLSSQPVECPSCY